MKEKFLNLLSKITFYPRDIFYTICAYISLRLFLRAGGSITPYAGGYALFYVVEEDGKLNEDCVGTIDKTLMFNNKAVNHYFSSAVKQIKLIKKNKNSIE